MNAVITGATKGIGRAIALKLAESGYNLAVCARTASDLLQFADELSLHNVNVTAIKADLGKKEEVYAFCRAIEEQFDTIDVLINNAGIFLPGSLLDEDDETFEDQAMVNLSSCYYISKFFGKKMREQRFGHIFNICSVASKMVVENAGSYSVTKAAMYSLNNVLRLELAQYNVKVTAVLPGSTLTASWNGTTISPVKFVQPEDIAESINHALNLSVGVNVDEITLRPLNF